MDPLNFSTIAIIWEISNTQDVSTEVPHMDRIGKTAILSLYTVISAGFVTCTHMRSGLELCMHHITKVDKLSHIEKSTLNFQITKLKPLPTFPGMWYRGWNSDIEHFPRICGTCPNKNRYVLPSCLNDECACTRNRSAKPGCEVSTWLYC